MNSNRLGALDYHAAADSKTTDLRPWSARLRPPRYRSTAHARECTRGARRRCCRDRTIAVDVRFTARRDGAARDDRHRWSRVRGANLAGWFRPQHFARPALVSAQVWCPGRDEG